MNHQQMNQRQIPGAGGCQTTCRTGSSSVHVEPTDDDNNYLLHYLEHGEPELAGEILGLGMMTNDKVPVGVRLNMLRLATELNIDQGSVFDAELWRKLRVFASEPTS